MQNDFESLIHSFLETKVGRSPHFLGDELSTQLRGNLQSLLLANQLKSAKIGSKEKLTQNNLIRNDLIYWLDRKHNNVHENTFFDLIDLFVKYLNETCYTGITSYEFHYACYEKGSFYKRHLDQFQGNTKRAFSMIMYLNEDWLDTDGGELCIYNLPKDLVILPIGGSVVFFDSGELEHEVLVSGRERFSVTGWFGVG